MNLSGPDLAEIQCRVPDGCCGPAPCDVTLDNFICQLRALLPEGQLYNNTLNPTPTQLPTIALGAVLICDNKIGCVQLILGGCCGDDIICNDDPPSPQLAVVDAFSAVAFGAVQALCIALRELDPCRAQLTVHQWARRYGIGYPDPCVGQWSDPVLALLICVLLRLRFEVRNWEFFQRIGAFFGAEMVMRYAGQFDCPEQHPTGWWTMARDRSPDCPPVDACPPPAPMAVPLIRMTPTCDGTHISFNIIMSPGPRVIPPNCNLPTLPSPQPHDPELYEVWKWLLPQLLPAGPYWCIYQRDPANCIT
jgi:hypothetical protein